MQAEYNRRPWGEIRRDKMLAMLAQTFLLPHVGKDGKVPDLDAFTPFIETPKLTEEQVAAKFAKMLGVE